MADVPISLYTSVVKLTGENVAPPSLPPSLEETQPAINPPGTSDISGLVPYNGAIDNVNLGEKGLSTGFVQYDNTPTDTPTGSGTVVWNPDKYTLDLSMGLGDSVQQIGMETYYTPVKNQTGSLIPDGTFVMATGSLGNSGRITVAPAVTDGSVDSKYMLGVTTHDIADGEDGLVTWFGEIRGFNTNTKAPVGETWVDGTVLWNNPAVAGGFTSVEPQAPNLKIPVAIVISAGNNGVIFVRPRLGMRLTDLHDVDAFTPSDKDLISYDSALGHWNAKSLGAVIGGTSSQFLKGDGSLDSNSYALASQISIASGQVAFGTGTGTIGGDSGLFWNNTNKRLGIGTVSPSSTLNVNGTITSTNEFYSTNKIAINNATTGYFGIINELSSDYLRLLSSVSGVATFGNISTGTGVPIGYNFYTRLSVNTRLTILNNGLIGINTNAPTNTLDVNGTARIRTLSNATGDFVTASATGVLQKRTASETLADIGGIGGTGTTNYIPKFTASGTIGNSQIFINGSYVGIGTVTPVNKLEVNGSVYARSSNFIVLGVDQTDSGKIRMGVTSASADGFVDVSGNSTFAGQGVLRLFTEGTERMRVTSDGNVGIATNSPTNTLDVNGTARIRTLSNATGNFLTTSATGVLQQRTPAETLADIGAVQSVTAGTGIAIYGTTVNPSVWLTGQALSFHALGGTGLVYRTTGTVGVRTITGGAGITVSNGDGVAGNPTISLNKPFDRRLDTSQTQTVLSTGYSIIALGMSMGSGSRDKYVYLAEGNFLFTQTLSSTRLLEIGLHIGLVSYLDIPITLNTNANLRLTVKFKVIWINSQQNAYMYGEVYYRDASAGIEGVVFRTEEITGFNPSSNYNMNFSAKIDNASGTPTITRKGVFSNYVESDIQIT